MSLLYNYYITQSQDSMAGSATILTRILIVTSCLWVEPLDAKPCSGTHSSYEVSNILFSGFKITALFLHFVFQCTVKVLHFTTQQMLLMSKYSLSLVVNSGFTNLSQFTHNIIINQ